jgi:hypothetical protein
MRKSLEQIKEELSQKYLGKRGIHGVGYRRSKNAIVFYAEKKTDEDWNDLREQLKKDAKPYQVILLEEGAPRIH